MEAVVPLEVESKEHANGFFVPEFEVKVSGKGLPDFIVRDITEVTYKDNIDDMDSFELTVNNWDEQKWAFKYIGSETDAILKNGGEQAFLYKVFEPCVKDKEVEIHMGYVGSEKKLMVRGSFTTMEPNFPSGGPPTLSIRGLNVLHRLRRKKYDDAWENKQDSVIAQEIAQRKDPKAKNAKRFPIPIRIDRNALGDEPSIPFIGMKKEYDIDFLWKRARVRGYVLVVEEKSLDEEGVDAPPPPRLYFGRSETGKFRAFYELEWGKSLIDFKPTLTAANQFKSVTVNGWDRKKQKAISETVTLEKAAETCKKLKHLNEDLQEILMGCEPREEHVVDEPVFDKKQAKERACALLLDQFKQMVKTSGTTVGLPHLVAGSKIAIKGVGARLSGTYFVTETVHTINDSGYITKFKARREDESQGGNQ